jgi:hypothetical protein
MTDREEFKAENERILKQNSAGVRPVPMKSAEFPEFLAEFVVKDEDLIIHLFQHPGFYWEQISRDRVWDAIIKGFRLESYQDRVVLEWIQELYSWCITVKKVAIVSAPPDEEIVQVLLAISGVSRPMTT